MPSNDPNAGTGPLLAWRVAQLERELREVREDSAREVTQALKQRDKQILDHEARLRVLEPKRSRQDAFNAVAIFLATLFGGLIGATIWDLVTRGH